MSDGISDMLRGLSDYCPHGRAVEDGESCFNCDAEPSKVNLQLLARVAELEAKLVHWRPIARAAVRETEAEDAVPLYGEDEDRRAETLSHVGIARAYRAGRVNALPEEERAELTKGEN